MPRQPRAAPAGIVYHVINRGVGRMTLFENDLDYEAFERCMLHAYEQTPIGLFSYCLMPNHWHLLVRPGRVGDLGSFMQRLTITHARRWQEHRQLHGTGHVYQGRYKSFPVQTDQHFLTVARYVERNALSAGLVDRAEHWPWGSLARRRAQSVGNRPDAPPISRWPVTPPRHWLRLVNAPMNDAEAAKVRQCIDRSRPFGSDRWTASTANTFGLESSLRSRGRPRKP